MPKKDTQKAQPKTTPQPKPADKKTPSSMDRHQLVRVMTGTLLFALILGAALWARFYPQPNPDGVSTPIVARTHVARKPTAQVEFVVEEGKKADGTPVTVATAAEVDTINSKLVGLEKNLNQLVERLGVATQQQHIVEQTKQQVLQQQQAINALAGQMQKLAEISQNRLSEPEIFMGQMLTLLHNKALNGERITEGIAHMQAFAAKELNHTVLAERLADLQSTLTPQGRLLTRAALSTALERARQLGPVTPKVEGENWFWGFLRQFITVQNAEEVQAFNTNVLVAKEMVEEGSLQAATEAVAQVENKNRLLEKTLEDIRTAQAQNQALDAVLATFLGNFVYKNTPNKTPTGEAAQ